MPSKTLKPRDLGQLSAANMKTSSAEYSSGIKDFSKVYAAKATVKVTHGGGGTSTGTAKLTLKQYADIEGNVQIGDDLDILTGINTKASGNFEVWWGIGLAAANRGAGASLDNDADAMAVAQFLELVLEVTEVSDGTTCVADVYLTEQLEKA